MNNPAFVTSFTGKVLSTSTNSHGLHSVPRCAMGDSIAPVITLKQKALEYQNSANISFEVISKNVAAADAIKSNAALSESLRNRTTSHVLPSPTTSKKSGPTSGISPSDYYFPTGTRNQAPMISFNAEDLSLSVKYAPVETIVAGASSTKLPFWKQTAPKNYGSPSGEQNGFESLTTEQYERYFPSNIRNRAPVITMLSPTDVKWNEKPYIQVGTEIVGFNPKLNQMVTLPSDEGTYSLLAAASTISKYYDEDSINMAPKIDIDQTSIAISMETVVVSEDAAEAISAE